MKLVLDASAILSGVNFPADDELLMPPLVEDELSHAWARRKLDYLKQVCLRITEPEKKTVLSVKDASRKTGDDARLSEADVAVLALAIDTASTIVTDDYSIQNLARVLGIPYRPLSQKGITAVVEWKYRCRGCGRHFEKLLKECPVCGSEIKSWRTRPGRQGSPATVPQGKRPDA